MSDNKRLPIAGQPGPLDRLLEGDSAGVIDQLKHHLAESPGDEVAWLQLGTAYLHIQHWYEAADALAEAVACDGDMVEARRMYAAVLTRLRRLDEAAFQLVRAKRTAPDDADVARELGIAFYDKRLYDKALSELGRARALDPADARTPYAIGLAHEAKGAMADAIAAYRDAVRIDPAFVDARRTLADALAAMGEMNGALSELEEALRHDRTNLQIATNLDVLRRGLRDLGASRLLGKNLGAVDASLLAQRGKLERERGQGAARTVRYRSDLAELWLALADDGSIRRLTLVLPDPTRAAAAADVFEVTVLSQDGRHLPPSYATAITVTFLREALGCPLTRASALYAELLETQQRVVWGDAELRLEQAAFADETHPGLVVELMKA